MGGWKRKLISTLLIYAAGFVTAIYLLAPPLQTTNENTQSDYFESESSSSQEKFANSVPNIGKFIQVFNTGLHKCVDFGKGASRRITKFIKIKIKEKRRAESG